MRDKKTPDPIDTHVGNKVRMRRKILGWSQQKLGDISLFAPINPATLFTRKQFL
jgi:hypothetical protein